MNRIGKVAKTTSIKIQSICTKGYEIVLLILICTMLFCIYAAQFRNKNFNLVVLSVGIVIYFTLLLAVYNIVSYMSENILKYVAVGMLLLMTFGLLFVGLNMKSARHADLINLHYAAVNYIENGSFGDVEQYFSVYPFQQKLTYILIGVYELGEMCGISDYRTSGTIFGAVCLLLSAILIYAIAIRLRDRKLGICVLFALMSNPIMYLRTSYYYTDIVAMPFFVGILYLVIRAEKEDSTKRLFLFFVIGLLTHTGMQIRSTVGIAAIAALICFWITNGKQAIKPTCLFVLGLIPSYFVWRVLAVRLGCAVDSNFTFPITHWIMMGMNPKNRGKWSGEMYSFTAAFPTYTEKISGNLAQLSLQIRETGLSGLCRLFAEKLKVIWADGTTGARTDLSIVVRYSNLYEYTVGSKRFVTNYVAQIIRCTTLIGLIPGLVAFKRNCRTAAMAIPISLFGYMLFYLFWEVHEKYVFMLFPIMVLISVVGIASTHQEFCVDKPYVQRSKFIFGKDKRMSVYFCMRRVIVFMQILTIIIAFSYSNEMIDIIGNRYETRLNQPTANASAEVSVSCVTQTFELDQPFNRISIKFTRGNNVPDGQEYLFSLESKGEILYKQTFQSNSIKADSGQHDVTFSFETVHPAQMTQYEIKLIATTDNENDIAVRHARKNTRNYYDKGELVKAGIPDGDMTFNISEKFEGTLMSKNVFYVLLCGSLLLESFLCYWATYRLKKSKERSEREELL